MAGPCPAGPQDEDLAGFFGPGSLAWRVNREICCLLAGRRAVLLQLAHPLVAAGVAAHSSFRQSPVRRLVRTLDLTQTIIFGTRAEALDAASRIRGAHRGVNGRLGRAMGCYPAGTRYNAHDPKAGAWVLATLIDSAITAHHSFARPLPEADQDAYLTDMKRFGQFVGVPYDALPDTAAEFRGWFLDRLAGEVTVTPLARRFAAPILHPLRSPPVREHPLGRLLLGALAPARAVNLLTTGLLPAPVREGFGMPWSAVDRAAFLAALEAVRSARARLPSPLTVMPLARRAESRLAAARRSRGGASTTPQPGGQPH